MIENRKVRVRFAPSPTGPLHIGGVRTALYNYLFARANGGDYLLRIEDTDRTRYIAEAEKYIVEALAWCGISPDEGPAAGGDFGPYRQSDRREIYASYAQKIVDNGKGYYAFDTSEELDQMRVDLKEEGIHTPKYDATVRMRMRNSLSLTEDEVKQLLQEGTPYTVRLTVPNDEKIQFNDIIRGEVEFDSNELDDKVLYKADGMPTYHMANVIDDKHMQISHVIRGEEWLSSTAHHVLLYRALGWEESMPQFAHLPLILKPTGKGKLNKRDGAKFGFPVFPLGWKSANPEDNFDGFDSFGFDPKAVVNFLAFLGWNPGTEQEIFSLEELVEAFSLEGINKSGARFDYDKAKWYNEQYIQHTDDRELAAIVRPLVVEKGYEVTDEALVEFCSMLKPRVGFYKDFLNQGYYFFDDVRDYDEKTIRKKWSSDIEAHMIVLSKLFVDEKDFNAEVLSTLVKSYINDHGLKFGDIFPFLRIALSGTMQGPDLFRMMEWFGAELVVSRIQQAIAKFNLIIQVES